MKLEKVVGTEGWCGALWVRLAALSTSAALAGCVPTRLRGASEVDDAGGVRWVRLAALEVLEVLKVLAMLEVLTTLGVLEVLAMLEVLD